MAIFYTADLHFGHGNILKFCQRPFASVEAMDEAMVANWNATVAVDDVVYVVGDFAYRIDEGRLHDIFKRLNGDKHIVVGNHDKDVKATLRLGWSSISDMRWVDDPAGFRVFLCHYGIREWPNFFRPNTLHLYGHSHANLPGTSRSDDCGVDAQARYRAMAEGREMRPEDYRPVRLHEANAHMLTREPYNPHVRVF